jgi:hypothetical protein
LEVIGGQSKFRPGFCCCFGWQKKKIEGKKAQNQIKTLNKTRGVSHHGLSIYIKKYLQTKEKLWKSKYFTMKKYIIFQKKHPL